MKRILFALILFFSLLSYSYAEIIVEAEDMVTQSDCGNCNVVTDGRALLSSGTISSDVNFGEGGSTTFIFTAKGSYAGNAWPILQVSIDGAEIGSITINSSTYTDFVLQSNIASGTHTFSLRFTQDYYDSDTGDDRNMWIDKTSITIDSGLTTTGFVPIDYVTYYGTTDKEIAVKWDVTDGADYYKVFLNNKERDERIEISDAETLTTNTIQFKLPRSGHYIAEIIACANRDGEDDICSESSLSSNPEVAMVNGEHRAWWIYGHIAAPGPIVIGKNDFRIKPQPLSTEKPKIDLADKYNKNVVFDFSSIEEEKYEVVNKYDYNKSDLYR